MKPSEVCSCEKRATVNLQLEKTVRRLAGFTLGLSLLSGAARLGYAQAATPAGEAVKPSAGLLSRHALAFNPSSHKLYAVDSRSGSSVTAIDVRSLRRHRE
jgi:hypothetical protein